MALLVPEQALRLYEDAGDFGIGCLDRAFELRDCRLHLSRRRVEAELNWLFSNVARRLPDRDRI